jgi:hypothetical protein
VIHGPPPLLPAPPTLPRWTRFQEIVANHAPYPVALRRIDWELAPFYCPDCDLNYCRADWHTIPIFDEGFL